MKQSILFEKGKLYVVELPEKSDFMTTVMGMDGHRSTFLKEDYDEAYAAAIAKPKVEVKNTEFLEEYWIFDPMHTLTESDTVPLPADLTLDKETGMLKHIEPEKPEETQEYLYEEAFALISRIDLSWRV